MGRLIPAAHCDQRPDRFHDSERPCALQKPIDGAERTRAREGEYVPGAPAFERVGNQHCGDRKQSEQRKRIHAIVPFEYVSQFTKLRSLQTGFLLRKGIRANGVTK